jgi:hypothetical protein
MTTTTTTTTIPAIESDRIDVRCIGWVCGSVEIVESPLLALDVRSIEKTG